MPERKSVRKQLSPKQHRAEAGVLVNLPRENTARYAERMRQLIRDLGVPFGMDSAKLPAILATAVHYMRHWGGKPNDELVFSLLVRSFTRCLEHELGSELSFDTAWEQFSDVAQEAGFPMQLQFRHQFDWFLIGALDGIYWKSDRNYKAVVPDPARSENGHGFGV